MVLSIKERYLSFNIIFLISWLSASSELDIVWPSFSV